MPPRKNPVYAPITDNADDSDGSTGCTSIERVPHYNSKAARPSQPRQRTDAQIKAFERCRQARTKKIVERMTSEPAASQPAGSLPGTFGEPIPSEPKTTVQQNQNPRSKSAKPRQTIIEEIHEEADDDDDEPPTIIRRIFKKSKPKKQIIEEIHEDYDDDEPPQLPRAPAKPTMIPRSREINPAQQPQIRPVQRPTPIFFH